MSLNELSRQAYEIAKKRGKYPKDIQFKHLIESMRSEIDEFEAAYHSGKFDGKKDSAQWELADICINTLSISHFFGVNMDKVVRMVLDYNKRR